MDESSSGAPSPVPATDTAGTTIVVRQSRLQRDGLFGVLIAVFLLALVRGYPQAQTAAGRIAVVAFTGRR
jgi:hypothetical protein